MMLNLNLKKDSLIFSRKRKESTKSIAASALSIFGSIIIACLLATALGFDPITLIAKLFTEGFKEPIQLIYNMTLYGMGALAFCFAAKAGIFNIGISGQMMAAGTTVLVVTNGLSFFAFPPGIAQLFTLIIAMGVGSLVALLIGALESFLRVNSVVSAIILNWIIYFICFFIISNYYSNSGGNALTGSITIPPQFLLFSSASGLSTWLPSIVLLIVVVILIFIVFKFTVFGHKIKSIGLSADGSRYAGYNVRTIKLTSFAISGAISGVLAIIVYTSTAELSYIPLSESVSAVPMEGFSGIAISLISQNNPIAIVFVSFMLGLFKTSSSFLNTPSTFSDVIIGLIMFGAAASILFYNFKPWLKLKGIKYGEFIKKDYIDYENKLDSLLSKYKSILKVENKKFKNHEITKEQYENNKLLFNENYKKELALIKLTYKKNKIKNDIYKKLLPEKIISHLGLLIKNDYDNKLNKYVSKNLDKIKSLSRDDNNKTKSKIDKLILKKTKSIKQTQEWIEKDTQKIINKYSKVLKNKNKFNSNLLKYKKEISEITNIDFNTELTELINQAQVESQKG